MSSPEAGSLRTILLPIFHARFDSVHKILHWPSFITSLGQLHSNKYDRGIFSSLAVLENAVSFAAVCTIADHESDKLLPGDKVDLSTYFRIATEQGLANSGLLHHPDIILLQAFAIYLVSISLFLVFEREANMRLKMVLRTCSSTAATWSLFALAVTVGNQLGLGFEVASNFSAFDLEIRKRLWYYMGVLDSHTCLDRGTPPLMTSREFRKPPINCNDEDLAPGLPMPQPSHQLTEMTFSMITHKAMVNQRKLLGPPKDGEDERSHWLRKSEMVNSFELRMRTRYSTIDMEHAAPIEKLIKLASDDMAMTAHLLLRRPPYKREDTFVPQEDGFDNLGAATEVFVRDMRLRIPALAQWAWKAWVEWYALAIILAELCSRPHDTQSEKAFVVAHDAYKSYAPHIADSESGMLWKLISKLMRRVQHERSGSGLHHRQKFFHIDFQLMALTRTS